MSTKTRLLVSSTRKEASAGLGLQTGPIKLGKRVGRLQIRESAEYGDPQTGVFFSVYSWTQPRRFPNREPPTKNRQAGLEITSSHPTGLLQKLVTRVEVDSGEKVIFIENKDTGDRLVVSERIAEIAPAPSCQQLTIKLDKLRRLAVVRPTNQIEAEIEIGTNAVGSRIEVF
jgi:hypothetical protein